MVRDETREWIDQITKRVVRRMNFVLSVMRRGEMIYASEE